MQSGDSDADNDIVAARRRRRRQQVDAASDGLDGTHRVDARCIECVDDRFDYSRPTVIAACACGAPSSTSSAGSAARGCGDANAVRLAGEVICSCRGHAAASLLMRTE
jgi:hypothetical protein